MASCCFWPSSISRSAAPSSLRFFDVARLAKAVWSSSLAMPLRGRLEVHPQRAFDRHLEKAEFAVLEDARDDAGLGLAVF